MFFGTAGERCSCHQHFAHACPSQFGKNCTHAINWKEDEKLNNQYQ